MKTLADHIGVNWVKWLLFIVFSSIMGFNTYVITKVDAIEKDTVKKPDYIREIVEFKKSIKSLDKKINVLLIKNSINPDDIIEED